MTKEQAINILELYSGNRFGIISEDFWNAVNLALDSLKSTDNDEPDWSKAPEWAQWYAIDDDGNGFWYENEPVRRGNDFYPISGRDQLDYKTKSKTLFKRPEQ